MKRFTFVPLLALLMAACSDATGPDQTQDITLPAFDQQAITVEAGYTYIQSLVLYAPVGVDPLVDARSSYKAVTVVGTPERLAEQDLTCASPCSRTRWRISVYFRGEEPGESLVTVELRSNVRQSSSFRVKVIPPHDGRG